MWPTQSWTPDGGAPSSDPLRLDSTQDGKEDKIFGILAAPLLTPGSVPLAPGDSTADSIDFSELMTKPEAIIESPGAQVWDTNFEGLSNFQSVPNVNSSNRFQFEINSEMPTALSNSDSIPLPQNLGSEKVKPTHGKFYEEIIKDSM